MRLHRTSSCRPRTTFAPGCRPMKRGVWRGSSLDRKSTRLNSSHPSISYAVFCLKKKMGLGTAVDYALGLGIDAIEARCRLLADRLRRGLSAIPGPVLRDLGRQPSAIVSFPLAGH